MTAPIRSMPELIWWCWRNAWRGYSDDDLESALAKILKDSGRPGGIIKMSTGELNAYMAHCREMSAKA
jgi:hypothetical protein